MPPALHNFSSFNIIKKKKATTITVNRKTFFSRYSKHPSLIYIEKKKKTFFKVNVCSGVNNEIFFLEATLFSFQEKG